MKRVGTRVTLALLLSVPLLYVPDCDVPVAAAEGAVFEWDQGAVWSRLEARFRNSRQRCSPLDEEIPDRILAIGATLDGLDGDVAHDDPALDALENTFFEAAADVAACPTHAEALLALHARIREVIKSASQTWDLGVQGSRDRLYRLLYGGRMAVEEVLLQMPADGAPTLSMGCDEPSASPSTMVHGVRVHSGDMLVSRGGAPTSALIARGNDYPGNFSHVALVHVDEQGVLHTIESHIEVGVVVAGLERYEADRKLRVMLLRPRADLRQGAFAHAAASHAREQAEDHHIPYDFAMDYHESDKLYCSEVASEAYRTQDIELWRGLTSTSDQATARWLSRFGVRTFVTHGPSDLEYDPQLVVVAEWRDRDALYEDHVDAAVIDAMLLGAQEGDEIGYSRAMLPVARLLKAWSVLNNLVGREGPIPEGMNATTGLRIQWLREQHLVIETAVLAAAERFEANEGYRAPYWELVDMAVAARISASR